MWGKKIGSNIRHIGIKFFSFERRCGGMDFISGSLLPKTH